MITKVAEWGVAKAYVEVVLQGRKAEAAAAGEGTALRTGGEVEEALQNWRTDEEWERRQGTNGASGSTSRSTLNGALSARALQASRGPWTSGHRGVAVAWGSNTSLGAVRAQAS